MNESMEKRGGGVEEEGALKMWTALRLDFVLGGRERGQRAGMERA